MLLTTKWRNSNKSNRKVSHDVFQELELPLINGDNKHVNGGDERQASTDDSYRDSHNTRGKERIPQGPLPPRGGSV